MIIARISIVALAFALPLAACKVVMPGGASRLGSLESLTRAKLPPKECKGATGGDTTWNIEVLDYETSATTLRAKAAQTLSAAPTLLTQVYFKALGGKIVISKKPLDHCSGFGVNDTKFAQESAEKPFVCWNYHGKSESSSLDIKTSQVASSQQAAQPIISVSGDQDGLYIAHSLLRALGFLYISKIAELKPGAAGATPQFQPLDTVFMFDLNKLTLSVVRDVKRAGIDTKGSLYEAVFEQSFLSADEAQQQSLLANEGTENMLYAKFVLFAETFDSYYCTVKSRQDMLTNDRFKNSYDAFQVFEKRFSEASSETSLALDANDMMLAQVMMVVMQQMIASIGMPNTLNPNQPGLNNGGGGLLGGSNGVLPQRNTIPFSGTNGTGGVGITNGDVIQLTNQYRQSQGGSVLQEDPELNAGCQNHSAWMQMNNSMTHYDTRTDYPPNLPRAFENIGSGYTSPKQAVDGWIGSDGHRVNMLRPSHTRIGAANAGTWWCQQFR